MAPSNAQITPLCRVSVRAVCVTCRVCVVRRCAYLEVEGGAIPGAGAENEEEKRRVDVEVLVGEVHRDQRQYRVRELNDCWG